MLNTPITPPRVPLIDPRTNMIDRAWYMFFLSLNNAAALVVDNPDVGPSPESLIASYDAFLQSVNQELQVLPASADTTVELQKQIDALNTAPPPTMGTVVSVTATTPVTSSGGVTPNISLDSGYGDTQNPYAAKTANYVLAGPTTGAAALPTFRALVAADIPSLPYGTGTVTSVSVSSANGFAGTVATASTTPVITLSTSITGLLFGNGTAMAAATISTPLTYSAGTLGITQATTSTNGYLSSTDWNTFNGKANSFTYTTNYIPFGQGTTTPNQSTNFQFNGQTLGIGGTLSAWGASAGYVAQVQGGAVWGGSAVTHLSLNTYFDGTNYKYIATDYATDYYQLAGTHVWRSAPSAAAGSTLASWTTVMQLDGSGNITSATWNGVTVAAAYGGTGQSSYAVGDILYASGTTTLSKLADVATGNVLISGGVGVAPSYGKVGLTTHVSGTLPVANGGTGASTASITSFNNITGYSASGATGTTSTNLVFSAIPTFGTTIGVGGATAAASGAGVTFPASASASTDVNTLDDYKEGTFTPTVTATTGSITSFGTLSGKYTKVGNFVSVSLSIQITNNGTGLGYLKVSNMPYTCGTLDGNGSGRESAATGYGLLGRIDASTTNLYIQRYDGLYPGGTGYIVNFTVNYLV